MPEKTIKRRLQELDRELAGHDGPIFATVAKLVEALKRCISRERKTPSARRKLFASRRELLRGTKYEQE